MHMLSYNAFLMHLGLTSCNINAKPTSDNVSPLFSLWLRKGFIWASLAVCSAKIPVFYFCRKIAQTLNLREGFLNKQRTGWQYILHSALLKTNIYLELYCLELILFCFLSAYLQHFLSCLKSVC